MPESMWFVLTTIVPIGYGDIIPESLLGKITATAITVFGTLIVTAPLLFFEGKCYLTYTNAIKLNFGDLLSRRECSKSGNKIIGKKLTIKKVTAEKKY